MTGHGETRIEQRVEVRCDPRRAYSLLTDPGQVAHFAARIEGGEVVQEGRDGGVEGMRVEMITTGGNTLHATIVRAVPEREVVWEDENGLRSTWRVEPKGQGRCVIENVLEGRIGGERARRLAYDADVKFQALAKAFAAPTGEVHKGEGASGVTGRAR